MKNIYDEVTVLIISHKSANKVKELIRNISLKYKILIIENSKDHSIKEILSPLSDNIEILFSQNNGYGSAINYGRKNIKTKYFFLFNPDVDDVDNQIIEKIYLKAKKLGDNFSCIGPRFQNLKDNIKQSDDRKELAKVEISGAAMFFNLTTFDKLNGFDENFFLYFEENDFCKRGNKASLPSYQLNTAIVQHNIGTSVEYKDNNEKERYNELYNWHFVWSKCYFIKKHYGYLTAILYFSPSLLKYYLYLSILYLTRNKKKFKKYKTRIGAIISVLTGKKAYKRI